MDTKLLIIFILLNITNVIIQTVKSLVTVKCGKTAAALANAVAFGLYTVVTVYMLCELPLYAKAGIVALCNLIGVYVVKLCEEKARKDKLWKVEATVPKEEKIWLCDTLEEFRIPFNYIEGVGRWTLFNCYCATKEESKLLKTILSKSGAKFFVSESKNL